MDIQDSFGAEPQRPPPEAHQMTNTDQTSGWVFRVPPGWPTPQPGWTPPAGWTPDPTWPPAPPNWRFWGTAEGEPTQPPSAQQPSATSRTAQVPAPVQPPAAPHTFPVGPPSAFPSGQPALAFDPRLSGVVAEYGKRNYKILTNMSGTVIMERAANKFNWILALLLLILVGVGSVLYVLIWWIWGVHRSYRVMLGLGPQGEVQEMGDVLAVFDRDRLEAHRKRCIGFAILFAVVAGVMAIGLVGSVVAPVDSGAAIDPLSALLGGIFVVVLPAIIAFVFVKSSRKAARTLGISSSTPVLGGGRPMPGH